MTTRGPVSVETILVVEDEEPVRDLLCEILSAHGFTVLAAADGLEAVTLWEQHRDRIRLIVSDVVMPRMNGPEFIAHITAAGARAPVLYVSGYNADLSVKDAAVLRSSGRLLEKPFNPNAVVARVRELLDAPDRGPSA